MRDPHDGATYHLLHITLRRVDRDDWRRVEVGPDLLAEDAATDIGLAMRAFEDNRRLPERRFRLRGAPSDSADLLQLTRDRDEVVLTLPSGQEALRCLPEDLEGELFSRWPGEVPEERVDALLRRLMEGDGPVEDEILGVTAALERGTRHDVLRCAIYDRSAMLAQGPDEDIVEESMRMRPCDPAAVVALLDPMPVPGIAEYVVLERRRALVDRDGRYALCDLDDRGQPSSPDAGQGVFWGYDLEQAKEAAIEYLGDETSKGFRVLPTGPLELDTVEFCEIEIRRQIFVFGTRHMVADDRLVCLWTLPEAMRRGALAAQRAHEAAHETSGPAARVRRAPRR